METVTPQDDDPKGVSRSRSAFGQRADREFRALFNNVRNAFLAETLVFLYLADATVIRTTENSPIDGAIYLGWDDTNPMPPLQTERIIAARQDQSRCCINFDVKNWRLVEKRNFSSAPFGSCWRCNGPSDFQRDNCDFIIVVFNATVGHSRAWTAVLPSSLFKGRLACKQITFTSVFLWTTIDPAFQPYALPIGLLPEAVSAIKQAATEGRPYRNPWSDIVVTDWIPQRASSELVTAGQRTQDPANLASLDCLSRVQDAVRATGKFQFELNEVQPLLGDFLLIDAAADGRQYLFEHKSGQFTETDEFVTFCLHNGDLRRNPFLPYRLWDFILFQDYNSGIAYCIPRNHVPDRLCLASTTTYSIPRKEMEQWRLSLGGRWVERMFEQIVLPFFSPPAVRTELLPATLYNLDVASNVFKTDPDTGYAQQQEQEQEQEADPVPGLLRHVRGYALHPMICHIQDLCATFGEGVILPLWRYCPYGDYLYLRWAWTHSEQREYWSHRKLPLDLVDRRVYAKTTFGIPLVTAALYEDYKGVTLSTPAIADKYGSEDRRDDYFLTRSAPFVFLGDPCPASLNEGATDCPHPYLMVPSEHLQRSHFQDCRRARPVQYWLKGYRDPYRFALPVAKIYENLTRLVSAQDSVQLNAHALMVDPKTYRATLQSIWQAQADATREDARASANEERGSKRNRNLLRTSFTPTKSN